MHARTHTMLQGCRRATAAAVSGLARRGSGVVVLGKRRASYGRQGDGSAVGTVVVTGGSSGIGKAIVDSFLQRGHTVYNFDTQDPDAEETGCTNDGVQAHFLRVDMADEQSVAEAAQHVIHE